MRRSGARIGWLLLLAAVTLTAIAAVLVADAVFNGVNLTVARSVFP